MNYKGNKIALTAMALSAVASISAITQEDVTRLRAQAGRELTRGFMLEELAPEPQRIAGLQGQSRAFLAPSMEEYAEQLEAREIELAQEELETLELQAAAQQPQYTQEELAAIARQQELNALLQQELVAQVALAQSTQQLADVVVVFEDEEEPAEAPGFIAMLRNRIASLLGRD